MWTQVAEMEGRAHARTSGEEKISAAVKTENYTPALIARIARRNDARE